MINIPKKGRIRILLAFVAFIIILRALPDNRKPDESAPALKEAPGCVESVVPFRKFRYLSRENVAELMKQYPPALRSSRDTLKFSEKRLVVHYSIDDDLQETARRLFAQYKPLCGAAAAIEPSTGRVLALCSYGSRPDLPDSALFLKNLFPAASIFKIVTASASIETGKFGPNSLISFAGNRYTLYRFQLKDDARYGNLTSLSEAFALSINPVFGKIGMNALGGAIMNDYAGKFGYGCRVPFDLEADTSLVKPCDSAYQLAELASGFNEETRLTPLLAALITASLVENGRMYRPTLVDSVVDPEKGAPIFRASPLLWKTPVKESTARELRGMMERVVHQGTARKSFVHVIRSFSDDTQLGGKTGSIHVNGFGKIDWFTGFGRHKADERQRIAVAVVAVFGPYWTVHSSYIGAEMVRVHTRNILAADRERAKSSVVSQKETGAAGQAGL